MKWMIETEINIAFQVLCKFKRNTSASMYLRGLITMAYYADVINYETCKFIKTAAETVYFE